MRFTFRTYDFSKVLIILSLIIIIVCLIFFSKLFIKYNNLSGVLANKRYSKQCAFVLYNILLAEELKEKL